MSIEHNFDIPFVAGMALREKQIQQNYRPVIAVHKWFARRPGTLFRALLLAEFARGPLRDVFFKANCLRGLRIADPFMGGGTPLLEANRLGCDVMGCDINPMARWIVSREIEWLDLPTYQQAAARMIRGLGKVLGPSYETRCLGCHAYAPVKYFLWVKTQTCLTCGLDVDLFPGYLLCHQGRHPHHVFVCAKCGALTETTDIDNPGVCGACEQPLGADAVARKGRFTCQACGGANRYPDPARGAPRHRMFAIEYYCRGCKPAHHGRFFKKPDDEDHARFADAETNLARLRPRFIPPDEIPPGDETARLHRWGYRRYREMFNARQLLGLESAARLVARQQDERVRNALATNFSDLLRYQNMLCRYDVVALKSLDIFSVHGFPVGLIQCESNLLGIPVAHAQANLFRELCGGGGSVGSGGWQNVVEKYVRAKASCAHPFEVLHQGARKTLIPISGEWIGDAHPDLPAASRRKVDLRCQSADEADLPPESLDAVLTDPPYYSNVQYAELMDFCYVWLRRLVGRYEPQFVKPSTRNAAELTGNQTMDRGIEHFAEGLSSVYCRMARALKPGMPLAFTYHNNDLRAYFPVAVALLDSGFACTAALPCPAEMAGSIHIAGTQSSIVDTIFVCRRRKSVAETPTVARLDDVIDYVRTDLQQLRKAGFEPTSGDARCIVFGHLVRLAVNALGSAWDRKAATTDRLGAVGEWIDCFGGPAPIEAALRTSNDLRHATLSLRKAASGERNVKTAV